MSHHLADNHAVGSCIAERVEEFQMFLSAVTHGDFFGAAYHHARAHGFREGRAWRKARRATKVSGIKNGAGGS